METSRLKQLGLAAAAPAIALVFAAIFSSIVLIVAGSNPIDAFSAMFRKGTELESVVETLNRATPLYLSGVAAAIGFRMNLFNIGVEGQYLMGGFFSAVIGGYIALPGALHWIFICLVAMAVGGAWGGIAGALKVTRNINEVISTIMLNFIAALGIVAWLSVEWREGELSTNSGTKEIAESGHIFDLNGVIELFTRDIKGIATLSGVFVVAIVVGILFHLFVNKSVLGFDLRASGMNPTAAATGGVSPKRMIVLAMCLSGAVAGLVGMVDVLSRNHRYDSNFTPELGFKGIAVALLGRNSPVGVALAALLFAFMDISSSTLQIEAGAPPEIVIIMQGVILLTAVIAYETVNRIREREETRMASLAMEGATS